jgi:hypothetical protein
MHDKQEIPRDASWPARLAAMNVYYAQQEYKRETGDYATEINQLTRLLNQAIRSPFQIEIQSISESSLDVQDLNTEFIVVIKGNPDGPVVTVTDKRLLQVHPSTSAARCFEYLSDWFAEMPTRGGTMVCKRWLCFDRDASIE